MLHIKRISTGKRCVCSHFSYITSSMLLKTASFTSLANILQYRSIDIETHQSPLERPGYRLAFTARPQLLDDPVEVERHGAECDIQYQGDVAELLALHRPLAHLKLP